MESTAYADVLAARTDRVGLGVGVRLDAVRAYLSLVKPKIVFLVLLTAVVAAFIAAGGKPPLDTVLILVLSGSLAAGGASALNHYFDRDIDARMGRTRRRPLVSGQIRHPSLVLVVGVGMIAVGVTLAGLASLPLSLFELAGALVYTVVYTRWLKRRTALNVVIGGAAGSAAVLGGWAAVDSDFGIVPWLLASLVFFWTPAHFWSLALARTADYRRAGVPMLPVVVGPQGAAVWVLVHIVAAVALSIGLGVAMAAGPVYFIPALTAVLGLLATGGQLLHRPGTVTGWRVFKFSGVYLGVIFLSALMDTLVRSG